MFLFYLKLPDWASFSILVDVSLLITFVAAEFDIFRDRWLWPLMSVLVGVFGLLRWVELIPTKLKIETAVDDFIFKKVKKILNRE